MSVKFEDSHIILNVPCSLHLYHQFTSIQHSIVIALQALMLINRICTCENQDSKCVCVCVCVGMQLTNGNIHESRTTQLTVNTPQNSSRIAYDAEILTWNDSRASSGTLGDAKCVTEILGLDKNKKVGGGAKCSPTLYNHL